MKIMTFSTGPLTSLQIVSHLSQSTEDVLAAVSVIPRVVSKLDSLAFHAVTGSVTMARILNDLIISVRSLREILGYTEWFIQHYLGIQRTAINNDLVQEQDGCIT